MGEPAGTVVLKMGGAVADDGAGALGGAVALWRAGHAVVLVHGGGPEITRWSARMGLEARFVFGLLYSDPETVAVAEMALARVGKQLAAGLTRAGVPAISLGGRDAGVLSATPLRWTDAAGQPVDIGLVGQVSAVRVDVLRSLIAAGLLPVLAPVAPGADGTLYNVNADDAAADVAGALGASALVLCTDVPGILVPGERAPLSRCDADHARALIARGVISGGMRPKVEACLRAVGAGVRAAWIVDGRRAGAVEAAVAGDGSAGTAVVAA